MREISSNKTLEAVYRFQVRYNEVDSMGIVWHGHYAEYLELAREAFGEKYEFTYVKDIFSRGYYMPIVKIEIEYKKMLSYGDDALVKVIYRPTLSSKVCFDYEVYTKDAQSGDLTLVAVAHTVQVFTNLDKKLVYHNPDFYTEWKQKWLS